MINLSFPSLLKVLLLSVQIKSQMKFCIFLINNQMRYISKNYFKISFLSFHHIYITCSTRRIFSYVYVLHQVCLLHTKTKTLKKTFL